MAIALNCPSCGRHFRVPENLLGKSGRCDKCGNTFLIHPSTAQRCNPPPQEALSPFDQSAKPGTALAEGSSPAKNTRFLESQARAEAALNQLAILSFCLLFGAILGWAVAYLFRPGILGYQMPVGEAFEAAFGDPGPNRPFARLDQELGRQVVAHMLIGTGIGVVIGVVAFVLTMVVSEQLRQRVVIQVAGSLPNPPRPGAEIRNDARLRPCPDCERQVSRRAATCPHCGCPLSPAAPDTA